IIDGSEVGFGGYGEVYLATLDGASTVAVKQLRIIQTKDVRIRAAMRLARELRIWAKANHPNVLKLIGYHLSEKYDCAQLISPYMENGNIVEYMKRTQASIEVRLSFLTYVKLNVLISDKPDAVLCDFGLALFIEDSGGPSGLTTSRSIKVPPRHMSPELLDEEEAKHTLESDIWAWACTVFENLIPECWTTEPKERPSSSSILDRLNYRDFGNFDLPPAEGPLDDKQTIESAMAELKLSAVSSQSPSLSLWEPDQAQLVSPNPDNWVFWDLSGKNEMADSELNKQYLTIEESPFAIGTFSDLYRGRWEPPSDPQGSDVSVRVFKLEADVVNRIYVAYHKRYGKYLGQEVKSWRTFNHPRITPFIGFARGPKVQAMPCCVTLRRSANLKTYITGIDPQADRLRLLCQALEGLVYLHSLMPSPIIHGALKPENILVTDEGTAELCDLGFAKILDDLDTLLPTSSIPTEYYRYRTPEALRGDRYHELTPGADIYAMGSTILSVRIRRMQRKLS
ncbi:hypothetical protein FRC00_001160, partial [Tulasnella sp. 408]